MLSEKEIQNKSKWLGVRNSSILEEAKMHSTASDPTRLKILYLLKKNKELCVSDISKILDMSMSAISHQLSYLEKVGFVKKEKEGKIVCYACITLTKQKLKNIFTN